MRITLMIDIDTNDIARLQKFQEEQPLVNLAFVGEEGWMCWGRFVGAKEALSLPEAETQDHE